MGQNHRYTIVTACDLSALQEDVNRHINKGWSPIGGLVVLQNGQFGQAVLAPAPPTGDRGPRG